MANPNLSEIATTTLRNRSKTLADNVSDNTALLMRLKQKGNARPVSGGRDIVEELFYAENSTYTRYSGYETINVSPSDVISAAHFDFKQASVAVSISGLEELQNSGEWAIIDLLEARIRNAEMTFRNNLSADIYSAGTADGGKQIGGLQLLITDAGTGTVGNIISGTHTWWMNSFYDFSAAVGAPTASATTIQAAMNELYLKTSRNSDHVNLIVSSNEYYTFYWSSLQTNQRFTNERMAAAGFENLKFMGADVVFDGGMGGDAPSNRMYFLNTNFLFYRPHRDRNVTLLSPDRYATNQDAFVRILGWAGNLTISNRSLQGIICP